MIIIDDAITDDCLLADIASSTDLFPPPTYLNHDKPVNLLDGTERVYADYVFWDGWLNSPADTLKKRIVEHLWKKFLPFPVEDLYGIEYWTVTMLPHQRTEWHADRGFCLCEGGGMGQPAKACLGGVYYPAKGNFEETFLELRFDDGVERIPTKPNRFVIFDSANTYHKTTPTTKEIRYSMPTNLWSKKNPPTLLSNFEINPDTPRTLR